VQTTMGSKTGRPSSFGGHIVEKTRNSPVGERKDKSEVRCTTARPEARMVCGVIKVDSR